MTQPRCRARNLIALVALVAVWILWPLNILLIHGPWNRASEVHAEARRELFPVMIRDFEKANSTELWVANIPNENASVQLSIDHPHDGKQCLKLHYRFVASDQFQYLGISNKTKIQVPVHKLRYMLFGDESNCSYGMQVSDASGETHQYSKNTGQGGVIDFQGWKEIVFDLDLGHETWGGDKNSKLDYPITGLTFTIGQPTENGKSLPVESDLYFDGLSVDSEKSADETLGCQVSVVTPAHCSDVSGDTRISVEARGFKWVTAKCWKQGRGFGTDSIIDTVPLNSKGEGSFVFPANQYPHGPITVRIGGDNGAIQENCYLQLYNRSGVSWNEGLPAEPPAAAEGMKLVFADDFTGPLSISSTDPKATYYDHKPLGGDFSSLPFTGRDDSKNPFTQLDTYLRIRADEKTNSSGLISSLKPDGSGIKVSVPCYFECRFLGPNAPGTWPAFWLMTDYVAERNKGTPENQVPVDELDIIEAYGGEGPGSPNAFDRYQVTPHAWNQGDAGKAAEIKARGEVRGTISMKRLGLPSTWFETFHVYGCKITETDTIYYCDDIEAGRHETLEVSKKQPHFFMINLAMGGGWPVDLSRYDGRAEMSIDYVRVWAR